jgi:hypothetical protein
LFKKKKDFSLQDNLSLVTELQTQIYFDLRIKCHRLSRGLFRTVAFFIAKNIAEIIGKYFPLTFNNSLGKKFNRMLTPSMRA